MRYIFLFLFLSTRLFANSITAMEYSWDTPAPAGTGNPLTVVSGNTVQIIQNIPVSALASGLHQLYVRAYDDTAGWGMVQREWVYKFAPATTSNREILELQVWFDNGAATVYDVPDQAQVQMLRNIPIGLLSSGLHVLNIRARDNFGVWGQQHSEWVYKFAPDNFDGRVVAEFETWFDNGSRTTYDVTDGSQTQLLRNIPINYISSGLHVLNIRCRNQHGEWGQPNGAWVYKFAQAVNDTLNIVQVELQVDSQPATYFNVNDSSYVALLSELPASAMGYGTHSICARYQDERGIWSAQDCRKFFVIPGALNPNTGYIAGAECWINVDPGEGNGLALLPEDGIWDERDESAYVHITDSIPMGIHKIGVRVRDDVGQWSNVLFNTVSVGPLLVISSSGNDIVLNWTQAPESHDWSIWRATMPAGTYNIIATTPASTYTDPGVISSIQQANYVVSFATNPGVTSTYRLPYSKAEK